MKTGDQKLEDVYAAHFVRPGRRPGKRLGKRPGKRTVHKPAPEERIR